MDAWPTTATEATVSTLELRGLSKVYAGGPWAVRDVDLTIDEGTLLVIAGPSGCGKTTILRMVAGLEEPSAGEVVIDGVVVNHIIVRDPRLLLLDEPMSNLDAKLRAQTGFVITQIQRRLGLTTLMVTHDHNEAMAMGDQLAVMRSGQIVQSGQPIDVYHAPRNIFVAQFVGTMTIVEATLTDADGVQALRVGSHVVPLDPAALDRLPSLRSSGGRVVGLGLRPDALRRDANGTLALDVVTTTRVGSDRFVGLAIDAPRITQHTTHVEVLGERTSTIAMSACAHDEVSLWEPCRVSVDTSRIHLFDLSTGDRIT